MRCLIVDDDALSRTVIEHFVAQHETLTLAGTCESAIEAANVMRKTEVDLLFLDVEMPGMTGLELLKSMEDRPQVVLVTAKEEYAIEAFDVDVTDYLLKPVSYARFLKAVQRAQKAFTPTREEATENDYVFVKADGRLIKLLLREIRWIEAQGDYMLIHAADQRYMVHGTMKSMEKKLPTNDFARVHRSYIVRIDQIEDIEDATIVIGRDVVPIGGSYKRRLLKRLRTI